MNGNPKKNCFRLTWGLVLLLTACAGGTTRFEYEEYALPASGPTATLINELVPILKGKDAASVVINIDDCATIRANATAKHSVFRYGTLFTMKPNDLQNLRERQVPADKLISLTYSSVIENSSSKSLCRLNFITQLEEGKKYKLVGGYRTIKTDALLFADKPGCALGIVDAETMLPVHRVDKLCLRVD